MKVTLLAHTPNGEELIERAARVCYRSESKLKSAGFISSLIDRGHESVIEHASASFLIEDISRACSHQLVRHRLASFSQESQRYCDTGEWEPIVPPLMWSVQRREVFFAAIEHAKDAYRKLRELGVRKEDARFVLPNAAPTRLVMTANLREWRHIISLRCDKRSQWEIREVATKILELLHFTYPEVFADLYKRFIEDA